MNGWMNDDLTTDYLRQVMGKLALKKRILVWDACSKPQKSASQQ